ncbi:MAG: hypothetical protein BWY80_01329 [Firmicutes bacterium ADurb.Bin456]|nr:MAG: hypothetical protein BWY80_01329 [Firmicutes bacterium ADurb.Bin456]
MAAMASTAPRAKPRIPYKSPRVRAKIIVKMLFTEVLKAGKPKILLAFKRLVNREARPAKIIIGSTILAKSTVRACAAPLNPGATSLIRRGAPITPRTDVAR